MIHAVLALLLTAALSSNTLAAAPAPMTDLGWLAGKTWSAKTPGGNVAHIDTSYEWSSTGTFVRFDTKFVKTDGSIDHGYSGMFFVDPKDGPSIWYADSANAVVTGTFAVNGDGLTLNLVDEGAHYRVDITRTTPTSYRWQLYAQQNGAWVKALELEFVTS